MRRTVGGRAGAACPLRCLGLGAVAYPSGRLGFYSGGAEISFDRAQLQLKNAVFRYGGTRASFSPRLGGLPPAEDVQGRGVGRAEEQNSGDCIANRQPVDEPKRVGLQKQHHDEEQGAGKYQRPNGAYAVR